MKGHTHDYPYEPLAGLNPFNEALAKNWRTLEHMVQEQMRTERLLAYFAAFDAITSDGVRSISISGGSLTFNLDVPQSRFVHALARFTGLTFEKRRAYDGQSLRLEAKLLPEQHPLALIGLTSISVADYLPDSCKVVVERYEPLEPATQAAYEELLTKGRPVYKTVCDGVEEADASDIEPTSLEPMLESVEVPF